MPRLFRVFHVRRSGREPLGDRFARVLAAVGRPGHGVARLLFYLADGPIGRVSAVERIVGAFPETEAFLYRVERAYWPGEPSRVLSNYPPPWSEPNPNRADGSLPPERLEEVLRGIPRRFPLFQAAVVFDGVDWAGTGEWLAAGPARGERDPVTPIDWGYRFPHVGLNLLEGVECHATVECADPGTELDPVTAGKLGRIGPCGRQDVRAGFTEDELAQYRRRKAEAEAVLAEFTSRLDVWLAERVALPSAWPPAREPGAEARFSLKAPLLRDFRSLGFRQAPGPSDGSTFALLKPTPRHHVLELWADRGTWSRSMSCQFRFVGLDATHAVDLPSGEGRAFQYRPGEQEQADRVVANWVTVVQALERDLVPRLEAVYGAGPGWFPAIRLQAGP